MKGFRRDADGDTVTARFEAAEAVALADAARQLLAHLADPGDPAVSRLFPDAYPDDPEASAEFRRFTLDSLAEAKVRNVRAMLRSLEDPGAGTGRGRVSVSLDPDEVQSWLRALTDIRLYQAALLGIERDGDTGFRGSLADRRRALVYGWLGYVQESLVRVA